MRFESLEEKVVLATFAVIGDYGSSGAGEQAVANMVKAWNPQQILTLGDNNYEVGSAATIDANIGQYFHDYIGNYQGSYGAGSPTNRFFPVLGNHDWQTPGAQPYFDYFTLPGNERYYDFVLDNVHFFALDSDPQEPDGITSSSVQALWLRDGLANSQETFNVVYFHHAPYTSGNATYAMQWPFKQWGADAVLAGHQHQYERLSVDGLPYFVNGLGGAEIVPFGSTAAGSQVRYNADFGAMRLTTGSTTLQFEFLSIGGGGTLIDSFTIDADNNVSNDNFANATLLNGTSINTSGDNFGATFETSEPHNVGTTGGKSVWWKWTAPATGTVTVATAGSSFDTTLGIYSGPTVGNLTQVAANDDVSGSVLTSQLTFAATANQTYRISVDGYGGATGNIALQLQFTETPPLSGSDAFSSRTALVGANVTAAGTNTAATIESGEPRNANVVGGKSVWWSWTAPASGSFSVSTAGSSFDTTLGVYTGSSVNSLVAVASNDDEKSSVLTSRVTFTAVAGTAYQISVDGYKGASGQISLAIAAGNIVNNDNFASATPLNGTSISTSGNNSGATFETTEPYNVGSTGGKSVWWKWTAPSTGTATVATAGSSFDTTLGIYSGTAVGNLTKLAANDDVSGSVRTSRLTFAAVAGQTYHISVDGYGGATGDIELQLQFTETPPLSGSDAFSSRSVLVGANVTAAGTNTAATIESGEPRNANVTGGKSVWWSWTAPASGSFSISTAGSSFDTTLGIYTGSSVNALVAVASNDDETGSILTSRVTFTAAAGQVYQISVDGYRGASGQISLAIVSNNNQATSYSLTSSSLLAAPTIDIVGTNSMSSSVLSELQNAGITRQQDVGGWTNASPVSVDIPRQVVMGPLQIEATTSRSPWDAERTPRDVQRIPATTESDQDSNLLAGD
ncbi:MAG: metallophosphoesterase [Planctomycetales bacterium]|nr:metallophosphoesterase [Planctomycetales bacterium]